MIEQHFIGVHLISATFVFVCLCHLIKLYTIYARWVWNPILCATVFAYFLKVLSAPHAPHLSEIFNAIEFMAPVVFIICIRANFQEPFFIGLIEKTAFVLLLPILVISKSILISGTPSETLNPLLQWTPYGIGIICVVASFWVVIKDWNTDLVAKRRLLRLAFVFAFSPLIVLTLALHALVTINPANAAEYNAAISLLYGLSAFAMIMIVGSLDTEWFGTTEDTQQANTSEAAVDGEKETITDSSNSITALTDELAQLYAKELKALEEGMLVQEHYRQMGLTLAQLAAYLDLPEYRLRKAINQGLGFRNFNVFLNQYRLNDAALKLQQQDSETSILDISIHAGFNGLTTFNRSFKDQFNMTPREFRKHSR